ncbi:MAG TPA: YdcF family protein [Rhodocyclaceae bacterium]|nr:YdcF family protein [Rhodocyclaceae bacterium]
MFVLKRLLECLFLPPLGPLLLIVLGLLLLRHKPRLGRGLAWGGVLLSFVLMLPPAVDGLLAPLESAPPLDSRQLEQAQGQGAGAVVILGGGLRAVAPEYGRPTLNRITLERVRYGARVARLSGLPILVSGGVAGDGYPEARAMAESLTEDFGLPPRWVEDASENTAQNAQHSAALLKKAGIDRILLVTHAAHMRRAQAYFEANGMQVVVAPTGFFAPLVNPEHITSWLPSANAAYTGWYALHESAGLLQQRLMK